MKKTLIKSAKTLGFLLFAAVTLFALWAAWENWAGAREWKKTREMLVAEGIELDSEKLLPTMPPEDRNFARTPLIAAVTDFTTGSPNDRIYYDNPDLAERFREIRLPDLGELKPTPSWETGTPAKLDEVRKVIAGETGGDGDILAWMEQFKAELAEIDAAALRPENQLPVPIGDNFVDLVTITLPYLQDLHHFQELQLVRICAALHAGDAEQARAALLASLQLQRACTSHSTLVGYLIGRAMLERVLSVVWEGLEADLWTEDDLRWIRDQLATVDTLSRLEESMVFEMVAFQIAAASSLKSISVSDARQLVHSIGELGGPSSVPTSWGLLALIIPDGIWDYNLAYGARAMFEESILPVRERRLPDPKRSRRTTESRNLHNFFAYLTLPAYSRIIANSFETTVTVDLARIACAAELYRIEHGDYPPSADALVPDFLDKIPEDIFDPGKPLKYKKGAQGDRYRIYSIGKNATDDGGEVVFLSGDGKSKRDLEKGDWAWGYTF